MSRKMISIVGAGRMGRGIAHVFAYSGFQVRLIDIKERTEAEKKKLIAEATEEMKRNLLFFLSAGMIQDLSIVDRIINRIQIYDSAHLKNGLADSSIVFEAVPEVMEVKKAAFEKVCHFVSVNTVIASTTSSFLANELADFISFPNRFLNTHWLNPAFLIPLVEVSPSKYTGDKELEGMSELLESVGKVPIKCAPSPGFIVPRLQALTMNEAARLVEEGVASVEDVDKASRIGFGLRFAVLGLLEFIDWGGGDTLFYASQYLKDSLKAERFTPPDIVLQNMSNGEIGLKSGRGFYDFQEKEVAEYQNKTLKKFVDLLSHLGYIQPPEVKT